MEKPWGTDAETVNELADLAYGSRGPQHRDDLAAAVRHIKR